MILVDTSVWIDFFNGVDSEEKALLQKDSDLTRLHNLLIYSFTLIDPSNTNLC
jgi:predicted nucleic acid-binding protein